MPPFTDAYSRSRASATGRRTSSPVYSITISPAKMYSAASACEPKTKAQVGAERLAAHASQLYTSSCACCNSKCTYQKHCLYLRISRLCYEGCLIRQVGQSRRAQAPWLLGTSARHAPVVYTPSCAMPERRSSRRYMRARYSRSAVCRLGSRSTQAARAPLPPPHSALSAPCRRHPRAAPSVVTFWTIT